MENQISTKNTITGEKKLAAQVNNVTHEPLVLF